MNTKAVSIKENKILARCLHGISKPEHFVYIILLVMITAAAIISPGFLQLSHMAGILKLASFLGIAAIGQTFAILLGEIDLSVANTITLGNVIGAQILMGTDANLPFAFCMVLAAGILVGVCNGIGIKYFKISPFIMTLGMNSVVQGVYMIYTQGAPKGKTSAFMSSLCKANGVGFLSGVVVIWLVLAAVTMFVMKKTNIGRKIFAAGANKNAARFSGINTGKVMFLCYIVSGALAAFTGFLLVGYTGTSYLDVGLSYNDNSIAAVVIGGTAMTGGRGGYLGTFAGVIIMIVLEDFLTIVNIPEAGRQIVQGAILIVLLLIYNRNRTNR